MNAAHRCQYRSTKIVGLVLGKQAISDLGGNVLMPNHGPNVKSTTTDYHAANG